ncbi:RST1 protein [Nymphaea thermarum]|nr:RST1 protein [Nymphaea thermarum]
MNAYAPFLDRLRSGEPSMQRHAVAALFEKLRSAPPHLGLSSDAGKEAIGRCLLSTSASVADQAVRELCLLVKNGRMDPHLAFQELLAALEGCPPRFVSVFVKGIGFLCRLAFRSGPWWRDDSPETHPFIKVLSCRNETQSEIMQQVILFVSEHLHERVSDTALFVRPFIMFTLLEDHFSVKSTFARQLVSCISSLSCSILPQGISLFKILVECMGYIYWKNLEYASEVQVAGAELLERLLSCCASCGGEYAEIEVLIVLSKRLLLLQRNHGLRYMQTFSSAIAFLFFILTKAEFEHEQLAILNLLIMLLDWRHESESDKTNDNSFSLREELLFIFPAIHLMASPAKSIKAAASELLGKLEMLIKNLLGSTNRLSVSNKRLPHIRTTEYLPQNLLQHLFLQDLCSSENTYCLSVGPRAKFKGFGSCDMPNMWLAELRDHIAVAVEKSKSVAFSQPSSYLMTGIPFLLGAVVSVLIMHQNLQLSAIDTLASIARMDQRLGLSLLLVVLFYSRIICIEKKQSPEILLKLLTVFASMGSHSAVSPLIVETISPMLCKDVNPYVRLLYQAWEVSNSNSVFEHLQGALHASTFLQFSCESDVCISIAACIRDVCKRNPDTGVDLILSVSACIESHSPTIQALGLESLGFLCEADVVDFYTAWVVIMEHILNYSQVPIVANSLATLLQWGAMDANAYTERSTQVLLILWELASPVHIGHELEWLRPRATAFKSLSQYEVNLVQQAIPNFKDSILSWVTSESDAEVLKAMEGLTVKLISSEHMTRRRFLKGKKINVSKIDKILDVLPRDLVKLRTLYEGFMLEIADSLQLSRNIFLAILSLQSWQSFMLRWMRKAVVILGQKELPNISDKSFNKFADDVLKDICEMSNGSVPRQDENMALAIGALGSILPPSAHAVTSSASRFLLGWLYQFEHESRQWTSAISLGILSSLLHVTDSKTKLEIGAGLFEVMHNSKSPLVKGACGLGLGLMCQGLLKRPGDDEGFIAEEGSLKLMEVELLGKLVRGLSTMIVQMCDLSSDSLERLCNFIPRSAVHGLKVHEATSLGTETYDSSLEDTWGIAGLAMGLGYSVIALHRDGSVDAMSDVKNMIMSWIPHDTHMKGSSRPSAADRMIKASLCTGACLVIPVILSVFQNAELLEGNEEIEFIINSYHCVISQLLDLKSFGAAEQSLLMASCAGGGGLISGILHEGVFSLKLETIKSLMNLMKDTYTGAYPSLVCLGGMIGIVNAMGAAAGLLGQAFHPLQKIYQAKESSSIGVPLLASPLSESLCTPLVQEIFLVVQDPKDQKLQNHSAWALSLLRHKLMSKDLDTGYGFSVQSNLPSQNFAEDSIVLRLSLWLMNLDFSKDCTSTTIQTISTVLRCLGQTPRLPPLDWGAIARRCMQFPICKNQPCEQDVDGTTLKEECLHFLFVHAEHDTSLLCLLDETADLPRFQLLQLPLQCILLAHLMDMIKIFSSSRMHKLWHDMIEYFTSSVSPYLVYHIHQKSILRMSFWKGLNECFTATIDDLSHSSVNLENIMHLLFGLLPEIPYGKVPELVSYAFDQEWSEAIKCLAKAHKGQTMALLQLKKMHPQQGQSSLPEIAKKFIARARLTVLDQLPVSEMGILKSAWFMLLEAAAALDHAALDDKRKWLHDAVEIIYMCRHPSAALQFLGLLSSCWSEYAPILVLNPISVLSNLPATLPSLLSSPTWNSMAAAIVEQLWASTERLHNLVAMSKHKGDDAYNPGDTRIGKNGNDSFLVQVLHETCFNLRVYLPFEKQLKLAKMKIT